MGGPRGRGARTLATAALLAGLTALASALACSLIVGEPLIVYCDPNGGPYVCGTGQVCAPPPTGTRYSCVDQCSPSTPCRSGETCDPVKHWCIPLDDTGAPVEAGDEGPSEVGAPEVVVDVVPMTDAAETAPPDVRVSCTGFGCECRTNSDCASFYVCVDDLALTDLWGAWTAAGGKTSTKHICARPCCTSSDCDVEDGGSGDSVCFATGRGGNYCAPKDLLHDRSTIGSAAGGAPCPTGTECRSGLCTNSMVCADTCCSVHGTTPQCTGGSSICLVNTFPGSGFDTHVAANCSDPLSFLGGAQGSTCMMPSDCRSNLCVQGQQLRGSYCEDPCRNSGDCPPTTFGATRTCEYWQPDLTGMNPDIVAACIPSSGLIGPDAGVAVCFVDYPGTSGDCATGGRCRPQPLTIGMTNYSALACGM